MYEINTIQDFQMLPFELQAEVQKAIRGKDRLDKWLLTLNKRVGQTVKPAHAAHDETCPRCKGKGVIHHEQSRDDRDVHPSQIDKCIKFLWYSCSGYVEYMEEYIEPRMRQLFDLGSAWHDVMQRYGRHGAWGPGEYYHKEVPIDPDAVTFDGQPALPIANRYWIRGSADALLDKYFIENVPGIGDISIRLVHEYKTINSSGYTKLNRPQPKHKYQATIYAAVFNVPIVVYFYTNKDNNYMVDFPVPFDHSIWSDVTQKIDRVRFYVENDQLPPWEETSAINNPTECGDCAFRGICQPPLQQVRRFA